MDQFFQREGATVAANLLAHKVHAREKGPVTQAIIKATEPGFTNAISKRAIYACEQMKKGKTLAQVLGEVQTQLIETNAHAVAKAMSQRLNRDIEYIKFRTVKPGSGRRTRTFLQRHFAFDAYVDIEVKIDGKVYELENVLAKAAPEALMDGDLETLNAISATAPAIIDLLCGGACSMDAVVCACMAAAMGLDPTEAAETAAEAANVIMALPSPFLLEATQLAADIMKGLDF